MRTGMKRALRMRHKPTQTECQLWQALRRSQLGVRFRRQWCCAGTSRTSTRRRASWWCKWTARGTRSAAATRVATECCKVQVTKSSASQHPKSSRTVERAPTAERAARSEQRRGAEGGGSSPTRGARPEGFEPPTCGFEAAGNGLSGPSKELEAAETVQVGPARRVYRSQRVDQNRSRFGAYLVRAAGLGAESAGLGSEGSGPAQRLLTVKEVAAMFRVCTATVYSMVERGELDHVRLGNTIRVVVAW